MTKKNDDYINFDISTIKEIKVSSADKKKILEESAKRVFSNSVVNETIKELSKM